MPIEKLVTWLHWIFFSTLHSRQKSSVKRRMHAKRTYNCSVGSAVWARGATASKFTLSTCAVRSKQNGGRKGTLWGRLQISDTSGRFRQDRQRKCCRIFLHRGCRGPDKSTIVRSQPRRERQSLAVYQESGRTSSSGTGRYCNRKFLLPARKH